MDESSIYLDAPSAYTYDVKGTKRVKANTTGNEKTRLSAAFSAAADGVKLPVFVIIPRKVRTFNVVMPHWDHAVPGPQFSSFKAASQYQILSLSATLIITSFYGILDFIIYYIFLRYFIQPKNRKY